MREFNASNYMVRQAKKRIKEKGMLESPDQKPGKTLPREVIETVRSFYESDNLSRVMPGKKDCISVVRKNGEKTQVPKQLILCNLKEAYKLFKDRYKPSTEGRLFKVCRVETKAMYFGWEKWYTLSLCLYHTSKCQTND